MGWFERNKKTFYMPNHGEAIPLPFQAWKNRGATCFQLVNYQLTRTDASV
jgi:hypothetical protein